MHFGRGWVGRAVLLVGAGVGSGFSLWLFRRSGLTGLDQVANVVGAALSAAALLVALRSDRRRADPEVTVVPGDDLARSVADLWTREIDDRLLDTPEAIPVELALVGQPVSDHWRNIRSDGLDEPPDVFPDRDATEAVRTFLEGPDVRGRLVILGEPGSGKTALLIRVAVRMLRERARGGPIAVVLRLTSWTPADESFDEWTLRMLREDYGWIPRGAAGLPAEGLIYLLDALDEMPDQDRAEAVTVINHSHARIVVTSRMDEYLETFADGRRGVLASALVLSIPALAGGVVEKHLARALPPGRAADWSAALEENPGIALALDRPLWISLARDAYSSLNSDASPLELVPVTEPDGMRLLLLDRFVDVTYRSGSGRDGARRWLRRLARKLVRDDAHDIAWWGFADLCPSAFFGLVAAAVFAGLAGLLQAQTGAAVPSFLVAAVGVGTIFVVTAHGFNPGPAGPKVQIKWQSPDSAGTRIRRALSVAGRSRRPVRLAQLLGYATVSVAVCWAYADAPLAGLFPPSVGVVLTGVAAEFTTFWDSDAKIRDTTPRRTLVEGRQAAFTRVTVVGIAIAGLISAVLLGYLPASRVLPVAVEICLATVLIGLLQVAWGRYQLARVWLVVTGRLPFRIMEFLEDAHRRSVLRRAGGVYQFRHALLRDRMAGAVTRG
ncbi:hypothetical protein [Cryptosporangium sp. NPDC051539]|uniref:hypothetical protein n=1 Tax=Cryptosporangium sp. NPDC051539 TaxID=3363962 RepID=UPI0037A2A6A0